MMDFWHYEAARCMAEEDSTLHDLWLDPDFEDSLLDDGSTVEPSAVYFFLQRDDDDAVQHFLFGDGIYFPYFWPLVRRYPRLQLLLRKGKATYELSKMLLQAYKIPEDRVIWQELLDSNNNADVGSLHDNNLVLFPPNTPPHGGSVVETSRALQDMSVKLIADAGLPSRESCSSSPSGVLLIPKSSKRTNVHEMESFPPSIHAAVLRHGGRIVNTSNFSSISEQVALVGNARVIIIPFGSGLDWNLMFMRGCTVIATNIHGHLFHEYAAINDLLARNLRYNRLFFTNTESELLDLLDAAMAAPPLPCPLKVSHARRHYPRPSFDSTGRAVLPPLSAYADKDP